MLVKTMIIKTMIRIYDSSRIISNVLYKKIFKVKKKLIKDQKDITGVSMIDHKDYTLSATSCLCDRIHQISNVKSYVNVELNLRTVMSANQLSIYGAVADMYTEISTDTMASGKPEAHEAQIFYGRWKFLPNFLLPTFGPMNSDGEICCENFSKTLRSYPNYALTLV